MNDESKCDGCSLIFCDPLNDMCQQTPEFKLARQRELNYSTFSLPLYTGSGIYDRNAPRKKGIRRIKV